MQEQIKDLIYSIAQGNASDIEHNINSIMAVKATEALDDLRVDVAKNMFNQQSSEE
ncbi:MAG: hypothetical protein ACYDG4_16530 [Desulfuromonadaceae bacterium]|jgi:hypothetical protein